MSQIAKSSRAKARTDDNRRLVMAAKVLISTPRQLDAMSITLHTNNERKDARDNCVGRRVKCNRKVHFIANADTVAK